jgi:hypothetical protein
MHDQQDRDRWVAEQVKHCRCDPLWCPCDGVLAGGMCDEITADGNWLSWDCTCDEGKCDVHD